MNALLIALALGVPTGPPPPPPPIGYQGWVRQQSSFSITDRTGDIAVFVGGSTLSITGVDAAGGYAQARQVVTYTWMGMGPPSPLSVTCSGTVYCSVAHFTDSAAGQVRVGEDVLVQVARPDGSSLWGNWSGPRGYTVTTSPTSYTLTVQATVHGTQAFASGSGGIVP